MGLFPRPMGEGKGEGAANTLCGLYNNSEALELPTIGWFWSSEEYNGGAPSSNAMYVRFSDGYVSGDLKDSQRNVICVGG